jgi:hypothetical protein
MSERETDEVRLLKEILKWTKFAGMSQVQSVLESALNTPEKRLAYQLSDGKNGTREVAERSKVGSHMKVGGLWKEWRRKGLGDTLSVRGGGERFKRTFDLEDFGIEFPAFQQSTQAQQPTPAPATVEKPETGQTELVGS